MSLLFSPQKRQSGTLMSPTKGVGGNEPTSIKVVVVGDSSSGKSSFVHLLSTQQCLKHSSWTVGCNVEVMVCWSAFYIFSNLFM
jgi:GTPase SAR1 family protein